MWVLTNVVPEQGHVEVLLRSLRVRLVVQRDEVISEAAAQSILINIEIDLKRAAFRMFRASGKRKLIPAVTVTFHTWIKPTRIYLAIVVNFFLHASEHTRGRKNLSPGQSIAFI